MGGAIGPHCAAAKAGLPGLSHAYAAVLAKQANAVAPALIETDMIKDNPAVKPTLIPLARFGQPRDVADVVLLLATSAVSTGKPLT